MAFNSDYLPIGRQQFTADPIPTMPIADAAGISAAFDRVMANGDRAWDKSFEMRDKFQKQSLQDNLMRQLGPNASTTDAALVQQYQQILGAALPMNPDGTIDLAQVRQKLSAHVEMKDMMRMQSSLKADPTSALLREEAIKNGVDIYDEAGNPLPDAPLSKKLAAAKKTASDALLAAKGAAGGKPSDAQQRAAVFATDVLGSEDMILKSLTEYDPTKADGWWDNLVMAKDNLLPQSKADAWLKSDKYRKYQTAAAPWINAVLYQRSGASIQPAEFARGMTAFFPQPGDAPDIVANKAQLRKRAAQAMYRLGRGELPTGVTITKDKDGMEVFSLSAGDIVLQNRDGGGESSAAPAAPAASAAPATPQSAVDVIKASGQPLLQNPDGTFTWNGFTGTQAEVLAKAGAGLNTAAPGSALATGGSTMFGTNSPASVPIVQKSPPPAVYGGTGGGSWAWTPGTPPPVVPKKTWVNPTPLSSSTLGLQISPGIGAR